MDRGSDAVRMGAVFRGAVPIVSFVVALPVDLPCTVSCGFGYPLSHPVPPRRLACGAAWRFRDEVDGFGWTLGSDVMPAHNQFRRGVGVKRWEAVAGFRLDLR